MLIAFDEKTGERVNIGDLVTDFRGDRGTLVSLDRAREPGRSGKVAVEMLSGRKVWTYDGVWSLRVEEDPNG